MPEPSPSQIDTLLERCILALEATDQAAVDAILDAHPDAAPALRERLDHLAALGILQAPNPAAAIPERLGEFRLLRQIGRGGMGIVYLAEQTALQRNVALKLVHPEQLFFGGARERFRREVLAVARLQHTGIVPILTCGEAEGIPFYAMDLVHGASVGEVLAELNGTAPGALDGPMLRAALQRAMAKKKELVGVQDAPVFQGAWNNVCCRLVLEAAEALQHAHDQGVLHRDIKPSNLLLTGDGHVRIIDFGLASARGEQKITRSRATFGSLPYMAPEQVRGEVDKIDARSDVYALGVTLYELLTLSLPHGDGSGETREHILAGHVEAPSRRNSAVHEDAEAICMMAMDLDPSRRYASAAAFAADLRAFLEHRTVQARRPSLLLRGRRWARRNPARAAFVVTAFVLMVPGPLAFAVQQNVAANRIQQALHEAQQEKQRAQSNFDHAMRAVDLLLLRTAEARLSGAPRTAGLRRQLLQDAIAFHESLIAEGAAPSGDQRPREEMARSQARLGGLQIDLGDIGKAEALLQNAVATLEALLPTTQRPALLLDELANAVSGLATIHARTDRLVEQEAAQRRAIELFDRGLATSNNPRAVENTISARVGLAVSLERLQRVEEAFAVLQELEQRFAAPDAAMLTLSATRRIKLSAEVVDSMSVLLARTGDTLGAQKSTHETLRRLDLLPPEASADSNVVTMRARALERAGLLAQQRREWDAALPFLDRAAADYQTLLEDEPTIVRWPIHLARVLSARATTVALLRGPDAAGSDHDRAVAMLEQARLKVPEETDLRRSLAIAFAERGGWHQDKSDHTAAMRDFARGRQLFEEGLAQNPLDELTRSNLASILASEAKSHFATRDLAAARELVDRAVTLCRECHSAEGQRTLIELLATASDLAVRQGDRDTGLALMEEAGERARTLLASAPDDAARQLTVAITALNHGTARVNCGQNEKALEVWEASVATARAASGATSTGRLIYGVMLLRLADICAREDRDDDALRWFDSAIRETGIDTRQLADYESLRDLYSRPEFMALLPEGHHDR